MAIIAPFVNLSPIALLLLIAIFKPCSSLVCKRGYTNHGIDEKASNKECESGATHCFSVICMEQNFTSTALLTWGCTDEADKNVCEEFFVNASNNALRSTKQRCECQIGDQGKDMANEHVKLPEAEKPGPIPTIPPSALNKSIMCKIGTYHGNGYGTTVASECQGGEHCYAVSCVSGSDKISIFGCHSDTECEPLRKFIAYGQDCQCRFGPKGEKMSNVYFDLPKYVPKIAIDIVFSELPIPTGYSTRANAYLLVAFSSIAIGFLTKFLLRAMVRVHE
ncbi:hypothetical protein niasHS_012873 [Heterodera schachtii]|uniref:Uncharacterized protein n=1 Tax=Heterodera schachtii TaxID=97005 RepID=A0ABD2IQK6_HETSC